MRTQMILLLAPASVICGALAFMSGCADEPESHLVSAPPPGRPVNSVVTTSTTTTAPVVVANPAYVTNAPVVVANPGYVTTTNTGPVSSTIVVTQAPPALQTEVVLAQPSPQHVWIPGYWTWRSEQYQWTARQWEPPPRPRDRKSVVQG